MLARAVPEQPFAGAITLYVAGEVDMDSADQLCDVIVACAGPAATTVVLDLTDVTFLGSSGLRALISARRILAERRLTLCVDDCSQIVERILQITGLRQYFGRSGTLSTTP